MKKIKILIIPITLIVGVVLGRYFLPMTPQVVSDSSRNEDHHHEQTTEWTCSMHPQIRQDKPGNCPLCGMALTPVNDQKSDVFEEEIIQMSPSELKMANVQTIKVIKKPVEKTIRLSGEITINEEEMYNQTSHISGRIERLLVNTTGDKITKGQTIAYIYSPELVAAQEELLESEKTKQTNPQWYKAAKRKLKNWKLSEKQIQEILINNKTIDHFPILSDISGTVINKKVIEGEHVMQGFVLFEVADLSKIWALLDAYESDLMWLQKGDRVNIESTLNAHWTAKGTISFIDPVINKNTRTAKVRVVVNNQNNIWKPGMWVIGQAQSTDQSKEKLLIPKSAVMWTGEQSAVYVKNGESTFRFRAITVGASLDHEYVVEKGLQEGEEIVHQGTFSVDAAAQLSGMTSMMNITETPQQKETHHQKEPSQQKEKDHSTKFLTTYLNLKNALVKEQLQEALHAIHQLKQLLPQLKTSFDHKKIPLKYEKIQQILDSKQEITDIKEVRQLFVSLSDQMINIAKTNFFSNTPLFIQYCPMAKHENGVGAHWISQEKIIANPYFGNAMLRCGTIVEKL